MKAVLIVGLIASSFLSPAAQSAVGTGSAQLSAALADDNGADFGLRDGRRGGGRAEGHDNAGQRYSGGRGRGWRSHHERGGGQNRWQSQPQAQQPQQPVDRRGDRSGSADQPQKQWRENRRDDRRNEHGNDGWRSNDGWRNGDQRNDNGHNHDGRQDSGTQDRNWDDRYGNGYDRERGGWDRNDRSHDDRYGNGWNRDEGRWNDRGNDRNQNYRNDRDDRGGNDRNDRNDRHHNRHNEHRWDSGWRNDRRYDWRGHRSQYRDHYRRPGQYYAPDRHHRYSRFSIGLTIGSGFYHQNYWLNDPWEYRLPPVHGPYRWVRYYDDVLLIDVRNGYVVDVINDFFW